MMYAGKIQSTGTPRTAVAPLLEYMAVILLFTLLLVGVFLVLRPFFTAFLFGGILAVSTWPLHDWMIRRGVSSPVAAALLCILTVLCLIGPILSLGPELGARIAALLRYALLVLEREQALPAWIAEIPAIGPRLSRLWHDLHSGGVQNVITPYADHLRSLALQIGAGAVDAVVEIFLSIAVATMFWLRGDMLRNVLVEVSERLSGELGPELVKTAVVSIRSISYGIVGTAAAQAVVLTAGLAVAGVPSAPLLGFLGFIIALSQIGILLVAVWGAAAYWLYTSGELEWMIFMLVWGVIVSTMDNVLRIFLVGAGATMPLTFIFLGVFGGLTAFGFLGMFIGPTLIAILFAIFRSWRSSPRGGGETCA